MWNASPCPSLSVAIIWWHSGAVVNIINPAEEGLGVLMCQCARFLPLIPPRVTKNMYQVDIHTRTMAAAGQMQQYIYVDMRYMCVHVTPTSCLPVLDRRVPAVQLSLRFILLSFVFLIFQVKVRGCSIWCYILVLFTFERKKKNWKDGWQERKGSCFTNFQAPAEQNRLRILRALTLTFHLPVGRGTVIIIIR